MKKLLIIFLFLYPVISSEGSNSAIDLFGKVEDPVLIISEMDTGIIRISIFKNTDESKIPALLTSSVLSGVTKGRIIYSSTRNNDHKLLDLDFLNISLSGWPEVIEIKDLKGNPLQTLKISGDLRSISFRRGSEVLTGLGGGHEGIDKRGHYYPMNLGQVKNDYAFYGASVPIQFLLSLENWALFLHKPFDADFDLREEEAKIIFNEAVSENEVIDLFFIHRDHPGKIIEAYYSLISYPLLPPKWALGYMQGHRTLNNAEEILELARTFRERSLPCDALIYLGTGYTPAGWNLGHGSLDYNPEIFDNPEELFDSLHAMNFKVLLHVNEPPVKLYGSFAASEKDITEDHIRNYWIKHSHLMETGVDGFWPDEGDVLNPESKIARHRMYYEGPLSEDNNRRPFSLHRTGYPGMQKYGGWIWSGDTWSTWEALREQVAVGLNFSVSGSPFWGSDIGGFNPTPQLTAELYVRWFQFGCFTPSFRSHGRTWHLRLPWGWNQGNPGPVEMDFDLEGRGSPDSSEYHNPLIEEICRKYLNLRYKLIPYNYSLAYEASQTGMPMMRPLWMEFSHDERVNPIEDQYMWGSEMLIAPVVEKGAFSREVYLPAGCWYDLWNNRKYHGNQKIRAFGGLGFLPVFIKSGAIIPQNAEIKSFTGTEVDKLSIKIYTGEDGRFTFYNDDGVSNDYKKEIFDLIEFIWEDETSSLTVNAKNLREKELHITMELIPEVKSREFRIKEGVQIIKFN